MRLYQPGKLYKYPHVYGEDKILLDTFWDTTTINFKSVAYDVAIGGYFNFVNSDIKKLNTDWEYLASFKIDMLGFTNEYTYIIELKHQSKPEAIGQLLVYNYLCGPCRLCQVGQMLLPLQNKEAPCFPRLLERIWVHLLLPLIVDLLRILNMKTDFLHYPYGLILVVPSSGVCKLAVSLKLLSRQGPQAEVLQLHLQLHLSF